MTDTSQDTSLPTQTVLDACAHLIKFLETMSLRSAGLLSNLAVPEMQYQDPLYNIRGVEDVIHIYKNEYADCEKIKFKVTDCAWGRDAHTAYIRWIKEQTSKEKLETINGLSELLFKPDGKLMSRVDYWNRPVVMEEKKSLFKRLF